MMDRAVELGMPALAVVPRVRGLRTVTQNSVRLSDGGESAGEEREEEEEFIRIQWIL